MRLITSIHLRVSLAGFLFAIGAAVFFPYLASAADPVAKNETAVSAIPPAVITKVSPSSGGRGQYITILGGHFGSVPGSVSFVRGTTSVEAQTQFPDVCKKVWWNPRYIIVGVPSGLSSGSYSIAVRRASDTAATKGGNFRVTESSPTIGICGVLPDNGIAGTALEVYGMHFGSAKGTVRIGSQSLGVSDSGWANDRITSNLPTFSSEGALVVVSAEKDLSNPVLLTPGYCSQESCGSGESCCSDGSCRPTGLCKERIPMCRYTWNFYTGILSRVGEACTESTQCISGVCGVNKTCIRGPKKDGEQCRFDAECAGGYACKAGVCASILKKIGASCTSHADCSSSRCENNSCIQGEKKLGEQCISAEQCATFNCYNGTCGQKEQCLKVETILPPPSQITPQSVFSVIFNQLIDEGSVRSQITLEPSTRGILEVRSIGSGDTAKSQVVFKPSQLLSTSKSYFVRVGNNVKARTSENTLARCATENQKTCTKTGEVCSLDRSTCSGGSRCTGAESVCRGSGTVCTGERSRCESGATCVGNAAVCVGVGTTCLGNNSVCREGAQCLGNNAQCFDAQSVCKGDTAQCKDGASCESKKINVSTEKNGPGEACAFHNDCRSGQCNATSHTCTGGAGTPGSSCSATAQCQSGSCSNGSCTAVPPIHGDIDGAPCTNNAQCGTHSCSSGACINPVPNQNPTPPPSQLAPTPPQPVPTSPTPQCKETEKFLCKNTHGVEYCSQTACPSPGPSQKPSTPTGLRAEKASHSETSVINISWSIVSSATGYILERKRDGETPTRFIPPGTPYADRGLFAGTQYSYRIIAVNSTGESEPSAWVEETTDRFELCWLEKLPNAPTNLTAKAVSSVQIDLSWTDASDNESYFDVQRSQTGRDADFTTIFPVGSQSGATYVFTFSNTALSAGTKYYYRIVTQNCKGSSRAATADATTSGIAPTPPQPVPTPQCKEIEKYLCKDQNGTEYCSQTACPSPQQTLCQVNNSCELTETCSCSDCSQTANCKDKPACDTGLTRCAKNGQCQINCECTPDGPETGHCSDARDNDCNGKVDTDDGSCKTTPDPTPPAVPQCGNSAPEVGEYCDGAQLRSQTCVSINAGYTGGPLSCSNVCTFNVSACALPAGVTAVCGNAKAENGEFCDGTDLKSASCTSLALGYTGGTLACKPAGTVTQCQFDLSGCTYQAGTKPAAPNGVKVEKAPHFETSVMNLSWNLVVSASEYVVERKKEGESAFSRLPFVIPHNLLSYADIGLLRNTRYTYRIRAVNSAGESEPSSEVTAKTDIFEACLFESAPAAPQGLLAAAQSSSQIDLAWVDASNNESYFDVQRSETGETGDFVSLLPAGYKDGTNSSFMYPSTRLVAGKKYYYRIAAVNCKGSSPSEIAEATTEGSEPTPPPDSITDRLSSIKVTVNETPVKEGFTDTFTCITKCADDKKEEQDGNQHVYKIAAFQADGKASADIKEIRWQSTGVGATVRAATQSLVSTEAHVSVEQTVNGSGVIAATVVSNDGLEKVAIVPYDVSIPVTPVLVPTLYPLTITKAGTGVGGVSSNPGGILCGSTCEKDFAKDTKITLTAQAATGSLFAGWSGACQDAALATTCLVTMTSNKVATALFIENDGRSHVLRIAHAGAGSGSVSSTPSGILCPPASSCAHTFLPATQVTLQAQAASGSLFTGWSAGDANFAGWVGGYSSVQETVAILMAADTAITASFGILDGARHRVSVERIGDGTGAVTGVRSGESNASITCPSACTKEYESGDRVVLTAAPSEYSLFKGWSGGCSGTANTCTVTVTNKDEAITALFETKKIGSILVTARDAVNGQRFVDADVFSCARSNCPDDTDASPSGSPGNQHVYTVHAYEKISEVTSEMMQSALAAIGVSNVTLDEIRVKIPIPQSLEESFNVYRTFVPDALSQYATLNAYTAALNLLNEVTLRSVQWSLAGNAGTLAIDPLNPAQATITAGNVKGDVFSALNVSVVGFDTMVGSASIAIQNDQCDYPWDYVNDTFDFRLHYCQGSGSETLLPQLTRLPIPRSTTEAPFIAEYLFQIQDPSTTVRKVATSTTDVIALRVARNTLQSEWWLRLSDWYERTPLVRSGSASSFAIKGFEGLRDQFGFYVSAPARARIGTASPALYEAEWKPYIYYFTVNTSASPATRAILDQILRSSQTDFAASIGYNPSNFSSEGMKLRRDLKRLSDLKILRAAFEGAATQSKLPKLTSGSYLENQSISAWRQSWNTALGTAFGRALPTDSYYTSNQSQFGCNDQNPNGEVCACSASYDKFTCWDDKAQNGTNTGQFQFSSVGSALLHPSVHSYIYRYLNDSHFQACLKLETDERFAERPDITRDRGRSEIVCFGCGMYGGTPCPADGLDAAAMLTSCMSNLRPDEASGLCVCPGRSTLQGGSCIACGGRGGPVCTTATAGSPCNEWAYPNPADPEKCKACGFYNEDACPADTLLVRSRADFRIASIAPSRWNLKACTGNLSAIDAAGGGALCGCTGRTNYHGAGSWGNCVLCGTLGRNICTSGAACGPESWLYDDNGSKVGGTCSQCGKVNKPACPGDSGNFACDTGTWFDDRQSSATFRKCIACGGNDQVICRSGSACKDNLAATSGTCACPTGMRYNTWSGRGWMSGRDTCVDCGGAGQHACLTSAGTKTCSSGNLSGDECIACGENEQPICAVTPACVNNLTPFNGLCICIDNGPTDKTIYNAATKRCDSCGGIGERGCPANPKCKDNGTTRGWYNAPSLTCESCGAANQHVCTASPACNADTNRDSATNFCVACGGDGQRACTTGSGTANTQACTTGTIQDGLYCRIPTSWSAWESTNSFEKFDDGSGGTCSKECGPDGRQQRRCTSACPRSSETQSCNTQRQCPLWVPNGPCGGAECYSGFQSTRCVNPTPSEAALGRCGGYPSDFRGTKSCPLPACPALSAQVVIKKAWGEVPYDNQHNPNVHIQNPGIFPAHSNGILTVTNSNATRLQLVWAGSENSYTGSKIDQTINASTGTFKNLPPGPYTLELSYLGGIRGSMEATYKSISITIGIDYYSTTYEWLPTDSYNVVSVNREKCSFDKVGPDPCENGYTGGCFDILAEGNCSSNAPYYMQGKQCKKASFLYCMSSSP